jgi:hypothetical protein
MDEEVSSLSLMMSDEVKRMRMIPAPSIEAALDQARGEGFILPRGAAGLPRIA